MEIIKSTKKLTAMEQIALTQGNHMSIGEKIDEEGEVIIEGVQSVTLATTVLKDGNNATAVILDNGIFTALSTGVVVTKLFEVIANAVIDGAVTTDELSKYRFVFTKGKNDKGQPITLVEMGEIVKTRGDNVEN